MRPFDNTVLYDTATSNDCKYNQYNSLNLSMGNKQNDLVVVNPQNNKENMKIHIQTPWVRAY